MRSRQRVEATVTAEVPIAAQLAASERAYGDSAAGCTASAASGLRLCWLAGGPLVLLFGTARPTAQLAVRQISTMRLDMGDMQDALKAHDAWMEDVSQMRRQLVGKLGSER